MKKRVAKKLITTSKLSKDLEYLIVIENQLTVCTSFIRVLPVKMTFLDQDHAPNSYLIRGKHPLWEVWLVKCRNWVSIFEMCLSNSKQFWASLNNLNLHQASVWIVIHVEKSHLKVVINDLGPSSQSYLTAWIIHNGIKACCLTMKLYACHCGRVDALIACWPSWNV